MRILIDTTYAQRAPHSGTGVYTRRLCQELARTGQVEVVEAVNPRRASRRGTSLANFVADEWWLARGLPGRAASTGADLIHHPLPARARRTALPQVITVHDLSFERLPECFDRGFRVYAHLSHRAAGRRAAAVVCVSQTTATDVRELWRIDPGRVVVARHGPGQELPPSSVPDEPEHFLYVGDAEPRKNLGTMLEGYRRYRDAVDRPLPLILAGSVQVSGPSIRCEPSPTPQRLSDLYAGAAALVHPSLYEGFGLTVLEAMAAGTPVIAARSPGLIEICDGAAQLVDAHDPEAFSDAMHLAGGNPGWREEMVPRGRARSALFSWQECAHDHLRAYSLALRHG